MSLGRASEAVGSLYEQRVSPDTSVEESSPSEVGPETKSVRVSKEVFVNNSWTTHDLKPDGPLEDRFCPHPYHCP